MKTQWHFYLRYITAKNDQNVKRVYAAYVYAVYIRAVIMTNQNYTNIIERTGIPPTLYVLIDSSL